jgi:hypothetical protein
MKSAATGGVNAASEKKNPPALPRMYPHMDSSRRQATAGPATLAFAGKAMHASQHNAEVTNMHDARRPAALHAALRYVVTSDIPSEHKATLIEVLTQKLRDQRVASDREAAEHVERPWQQDEVSQLQTFLNERVATSWQLADEYVMRMAAQLHRDPRVIRAKATELGLGASVDYVIAKGIRQE